MNFCDITHVIIITLKTGEIRALRPGCILADYRNFNESNDILPDTDEKDWKDAISSGWIHELGRIILVMNNGSIEIY